MQKQKHNSGFTLVEIMVAVSIFVIVAFIVTSTFIVVMDAYRKAQAMRALMDNLNFAMDTMVLNIREGINYTASQQGSEFTFSPGGGGNKTYKLEGEMIKECVDECINLTSDQIKVDYLKFVLLGTEPPFVQINAGGKVTIKGNDTSFDLQTTVSQRNTQN